MNENKQKVERYREMLSTLKRVNMANYVCCVDDRSGLLGLAGHFDIVEAIYRS